MAAWRNKLILIIGSWTMSFSLAAATNYSIYLSGGVPFISPPGENFANNFGTLSFHQNDTLTISTPPNIVVTAGFASSFPTFYADGAGAITITVEANTSVTNSTGGSVFGTDLFGGFVLNNSGSIYADGFNSTNHLFIDGGNDTGDPIGFTLNTSHFSLGTITLTQHYSGAINIYTGETHIGNITLGGNNYELNFLGGSINSDANSNSNVSGPGSGSCSLNVGSGSVNTAVTLPGTVTNVNNITVNSGSSLTSGGDISGVSGTLNNAGTITMLNALSGTGSFINSGSLTIDNDNTKSIGTLNNSNYLNATNTLTVSNGLTNSGTLAVTNALAVTGGITNSSGSITAGSITVSSGGVNNSGTITSNGALAITGGLTNNGPGIINMYGSFNPDSITSNSGTINFESGSSSAVNLSGTTGATLNIGNATSPTFTLSHNVTSIPTINVNNTSTFTMNNAITGVNIFTIAPGASATFANSLTGVSASTSTINIGGGTAAASLTFNPSSSLSTFNAINLGSNSTLNFSTNAAFTLAVPVTGVTNSTNTALTINGTTILNPSATISNLTSIALHTSAQLNLQASGGLSNIGTVTIDSGTSLTLAANAALNSVGIIKVYGTLTILSGATFVLGGGQALSGDGIIINQGNMSVTSSTFTFPGSFTNTSSGTFTINGTNGPTFNGPLFRNQGNIVANFSTSNTLPLITTSAATVDLAHGTIIIGYNNNYIATGSYHFLAAPLADAPLNIGVGILPQPSFYISSWSLGTSSNATYTFVDVIVTRDGFDQHALTPSAVEVGAFLETLGSSGSATQAELNLLNALEQITNNEELTLALESLLPPQYMMLPTLEMLDATVGALEIRLASLQMGYSSGDVVTSDVMGVWARPFASNGKQATTATLTGYTDKCHGWILGADRTINSYITLGFAGSVSKTSVVQTDNSFTKTEINNYEVSFYGTFETAKQFYIDGLIIGGVSNYHGIRSIVFPGFNAAASSNYSSQQLTFKVMASQIFALYNYWQVTPRAMAQYTFIRQLAYTESGAGPYDMFVDPNNINLFRLGAGTSIGIPFASRNMVSIPSVLGMVYVDAKGGADTVNCMFVSGGPVLANTAQASRIMVKLGGFYELKLGDNLQMIAGYDYYFRRGFQGHETFLNLRYTF